MQGTTAWGSDRPRRPIVGARRWMLAALCALSLAACGGSGSSGFDAIAAENAVIDQALDSAGCVTERGLTICASSDVETPATPPVSPSPTAQTQATGTPTGTPGLPSPTPTATATPAQPGVTIQFDTTDIADCSAVVDSQSCRVSLVFFPASAPLDAVYRAAVRSRDPDGPWRLYAVTGNQADVEVPPGVDLLQAAILLYERDPGRLPAEVEVLADSGADFAFVTAPTAVRDLAPP